MDLNDRSFNYRSYPRRLNIGCGLNKKDGFLNVDLNEFHHPDLVADAVDLSMLPDRYYESITALDVLEHIPRVKIRTALREWNRLLVPGGRIELQVPNVSGILRLLESRENQSLERQMRLLQCLFGTQGYKGDYHYFGFTRLVLEALLRECGFEALGIREKDGWLFHVLAHKSIHTPPDSLLRIGDTTEFVRQAYRQVLGRDPDEEGFSFYFNRMREGVEREAILEALQRSEEYQRRERG